MSDNDINFIELFAGIGGFRYGLESINRSPDRESKRDTQKYAKTREGFQSSKRKENCNKRGRDYEQSNSQPNNRKFNCIYANEWDKYAAQIYEKNFGERPDTRDIRTVDASEIPDHDLLTGGFPCQAFSIAGKRKGFEDTRGTLFFDIARILHHKKPGYFLLENVRGLLSHDNGATFRTIIYTLYELGYDLQWQVLNSKNFGVPQNRERVFIIGHLRGECRPEIFPIGETNPEINSKYVSTAIDRNYWKGADKHGQRTMIDIITHRKNYRRNMQVFNPNGITEALDSGQGGGRGQHTIQKHKIRRLTPIECERLQGFPDNWTELGIDTNKMKNEGGLIYKISDTQRYKCLGNAVTTNIITEIGKRFIKYLEN